MKVPKLADSALHVSASAVAETATQLAPVGSILILVRGMGLANGVPICELLAPCAFNQDIKALQPKPNVDSAFLAAALRQEVEQFKNALGTAAHGTLKIESEQLQKIRIPLPPLPEQRRIVAELDAEAAEVAAVRALIPRTEAKIQRVLARVWGTGAAS
jgi:type I restriction enzyme S subunit